ncbi:MAG: hypothetical protein H8D45_14525 [Bacteroidetes bacterium]|nr:hypothetical protein [Bacteroidota bacterium]MBL7103305.1 hypothetical protein [Bacteroidales bacterium]
MDYFQKIISNTFGEADDNVIQPRRPFLTGFPLQNTSNYGDTTKEENEVSENENLPSIIPRNPQVNVEMNSEVVVPEKNILKPDLKDSDIVSIDPHQDNPNLTDKTTSKNINEFSHKKDSEKKPGSNIKKASENPDIFRETNRNNKSTSAESSDPFTTQKKTQQLSPIISKDKSTITNQKKENDKHRQEDLPEGSTKRPLKTQSIIPDIPAENKFDSAKHNFSDKEAFWQVFNSPPQNLENSKEITPRETDKERIPEKRIPRTHVTIGKINIEVVPPVLSQAENKKVIEKEIIYKSSRPQAKSTFKNNAGLKIRFGLGQL